MGEVGGECPVNSVADDLWRAECSGIVAGDGEGVPGGAWDEVGECGPSG